MRISVFAILILSSFAHLPAQSHRSMSVGDLQTLIQEERDHPVIINFWATWCKPCVAELPFFLELEEQYEVDNLELWLVSLDFSENTMASFLEEEHINATAIYLTDGLRDPDWIEHLNPDWSGAIPATLLLPANGEQRFHEGAFTAQSLQAWIDPALH